MKKRPLLAVLFSLAINMVNAQIDSIKLNQEPEVVQIDSTKQFDEPEQPTCVHVIDTSLSNKQSENFIDNLDKALEPTIAATLAGLALAALALILPLVSVRKKK